MPLNQVIQEKRKEQGLTQEQLAELLGVSLMTVRRWEWGHTSPNSNMLLRLADVFGLTPDELLTGNTIEESNGREMTLGERIRKARKGKMTQAELANAIGVHEITVRRWELGERNPHAVDLQKIAEELNIPVSELLGEPDEQPSGEKETVKSLPFKKTNNFLVYERNGERLELPPTEESYKIIREIALMIAGREIGSGVPAVNQ